MKRPIHGYSPAAFNSPKPTNNDVEPSASASGTSEEPPSKRIKSDSSEPEIHQQSSRQIALLAQMYFAKWEDWERVGQTSGENRTEAVERLKAWFNADQPDEMLDLSELGLTSLPENFPPSLLHLDISGNRLSSLPENLPRSLQELYAAGNELNSLPENLPSSLLELDVTNNRLTSLPENLPRLLSILVVSDNQLTSLPKNITETLGVDCSCHVSLDDNPLPKQEINILAAILNAEDYHGEMTFSFPRPEEPYFAQWEAWKREGGDSGGNRTEAVRRMEAWFNADQPDEKLDLSLLELTSLPENLPPSLENIDVSHNRLTSLPENLPPSLQTLEAYYNQLASLPENLPRSLLDLDISGNRLTSLPENLPRLLQRLNVSYNQLASLLERLPPSLLYLGISGNHLTSLPENLPRSLLDLDISGNHLTSLPENLPRSLQRLNVRYNRLASFPENIATTLGVVDLCEVILEHNPLPERVINHLNETFNAEDYEGHVVLDFGMEVVASNAGPARPLADAVSDWHGEGREEIKKAWGAFQEEEGAKEFSGFLDRLRGTVNYGNPQFRQSVVAWLSHLPSHPKLRKDTFLVSVGATESCEDRVSLTYNEMKKVRLDCDVENGQYDDRLGDLVQVARGMFRLEQLSEIAKEKVASLRFVDEIEVYLAYQVKLRDQLQLPLDTPDMRFFGVSWVTEDDLAGAEQSVKEAENADFVHYLSTRWQPWQSVLNRLHGKQYEEMQDKLMDATGEPFEKELQARLKRDNLENNTDAQRIVGAQVMADIEREIKEPLTREFLNTQGLSHLLDPQW